MVRSLEEKLQDQHEVGRASLQRLENSMYFESESGDIRMQMQDLEDQNQTLQEQVEQYAETIQLVQKELSQTKGDLSKYQQYA